MESVFDMLRGAGLKHLTGGYRNPASFVRAMMRKQKDQAIPYNRESVVKPFQPDSVENPSLDIQRKYKTPPYSRFSYRRAADNQERRDAEEQDDVVRIMMRDGVNVATAAQRYLEETAKRREVLKPEYWGLTWDDFHKEGKHMVNADGLRWPPVTWINPTDKKPYYALACCGGDPGEGKRKIRYKMLYFKEDDMPNLEDHSFGDTVRTREGYRRYQRGPDVVNAEKSDTKTYRGVRLDGTNKTLAKTDAQTTATQAAREEGFRRRRGGTKPKAKVTVSEEEREKIQAALDAARGVKSAAAPAKTATAAPAPKVVTAAVSPKEKTTKPVTPAPSIKTATPVEEEEGDEEEEAPIAEKPFGGWKNAAEQAAASAFHDKLAIRRRFFHTLLPFIVFLDFIETESGETLADDPEDKALTADLFYRLLWNYYYNSVDIAQTRPEDGLFRGKAFDSNEVVSMAIGGLSGSSDAFNEWVKKNQGRINAFMTTINNDIVRASAHNKRLSLSEENAFYRPGKPDKSELVAEFEAPGKNIEVRFPQLEDYVAKYGLENRMLKDGTTYIESITQLVNAARDAAKSERGWGNIYRKVADYFEKSKLWWESVK